MHCARVEYITTNGEKSVWDIVYGEPKYEYAKALPDGTTVYLPYTEADLRYDLKCGWLWVDHPSEPRGESLASAINVMDTDVDMEDVDSAVLGWSIEGSSEFLYPLTHEDVDNDLPEHETSQFALEQMLTIDAGQVPSSQFQTLDMSNDDFDGSDDELSMHLDQLYGRELDDLSVLLASTAAMHI